ncbi:hypothetical protein Hanom_Chr02g00117561 [Helianthus anomalus]
MSVKDKTSPKSTLDPFNVLSFLLTFWFGHLYVSRLKLPHVFPYFVTPVEWLRLEILLQQPQCRHLGTQQL